MHISEDGPGQETLITDKPAPLPDLKWLEELYKWVFLAFLVSCFDNEMIIQMYLYPSPILFSYSYLASSQSVQCHLRANTA